MIERQTKFIIQLPISKSILKMESLQSLQLQIMLYLKFNFRGEGTIKEIMQWPMCTGIIRFFSPLMVVKLDFIPAKINLKWLYISPLFNRCHQLAARAHSKICIFSSRQCEIMHIDFIMSRWSIFWISKRILIKNFKYELPMYCGR